MNKKKYSNHQKPIRILLIQRGIFSPTIKKPEVSLVKVIFTRNGIFKFGKMSYELDHSDSELIRVIA